MTENKLLFLKNVFSKYEVQFSDNYTKAVILNPFYNENITVSYYEDDDFTPYCVFFSFQHCHLADKEDVVDWINEIITGRKYAIEILQKRTELFRF